MHLNAALIDITVILLAAVAAAVLFHRLNLPSSIGMLLAGVLIGPDLLGLVGDVELIETLSEIGVVLLLFIIGLEFSIADLRYLKRQFAIGGSVQFFGTAAVIALASMLFGFTPQQSIFIGFVVALSSTAVVLKMMQDRAELATPHGRNIFATLIYQDIAVVPVMLLAPLLAVGGAAAGAAAGGAVSAQPSALVSVGVLLVKIAAVGVFSYAAYRWIVPFILERITRTHSSEAFLLTIILLCFGIAVVTQSLGLSLALGAFVAGLIISESDYSHQAMTVMLPFRDIFMSLFFVSIGLLLDVHYLLANPVQVALFTLGLIVVKPLVGTAAALAVGLPLGGSLMSGLALGQVGEFSLVAARTGVTTNLIPESVFQVVLTTTVLSMLLTPALMAIGPRLVKAASRTWLRRFDQRRFNSVAAAGHHEFEDHIVIAGFGITGHAIARAARRGGVPYVIVETDSLIVRDALEQGEPIFFGDVTQEPIARHVGVDKARVIVITINSARAARRATELAKRLAPQAHVLVRTRHPREITHLLELGADDVVTDEVEVSVETLGRTLEYYEVPPAIVLEATERERHRYEWELDA